MNCSTYYECECYLAFSVGQSILKGYETPTETEARNKESGVPTVTELKKDYVNGDLGFDPLGFKPKTQKGFDVIRTKELSNGRLAMLGVAGMVAQELVSYIYLKSNCNCERC